MNIFCSVLIVNRAVLVTLNASARNCRLLMFEWQSETLTKAQVDGEDALAAQSISGADLSRPREIECSEWPPQDQQTYLGRPWCERALRFGPEQGRSAWPLLRHTSSSDSDIHSWR